MRLCKMGIAVHPDTTLRVMDALGRHHDSTVLKWRETVIEYLKQGCACESLCDICA